MAIVLKPHAKFRSKVTSTGASPALVEQVRQLLEQSQDAGLLDAYAWVKAQWETTFPSQV